MFEIGQRMDSMRWKRRETADVQVASLQLPFITLLGPIDITDWYSAPIPPSKDPLPAVTKEANAVTYVCTIDCTHPPMQSPTLLALSRRRTCRVKSQVKRCFGGLTRFLIVDIVDLWNHLKSYDFFGFSLFFI